MNRTTGAMSSQPISILFVCLGNICRSPLAEAVFRFVVEEAGLEARFRIDSAGTSGYHDGEAPDRRATAVARRRGIRMEGTSRKVTEEDLEVFDYLVVMDHANRREVERLKDGAPASAEVRLFREFDPEANGELEVPDPYFGGPDGFENVHDLVERSARGLLDYLTDRHGL
jgi:protein-tyrosine phosphatase